MTTKFYTQRKGPRKTPYAFVCRLSPEDRAALAKLSNLLQMPATDVVRDLIRKAAES